jgi:hypothetical protein
MWLYLFESHESTEHLGGEIKRSAAYYAQRKAFGHWQTWTALVFLFLSVISLALLDMKMKLSDGNGTAGAACGFFIGIFVLTVTIYRVGLPHYLDCVKDKQQK